MTNFKQLLESTILENKIGRSKGICYDDTAKYNYETHSKSFHATTGPIYHGLGKDHGRVYAKNLADKHNISVKNVDDDTFELEGNNNNIKHALQTHINYHYNHLN